MTELELENQRLKEENQLLKEYQANMSLKERMYDKVNVSVKQIDIFIGVMLVLLIIVLILGKING